MRLAEYVAHTTDVDGMLATMTHAQFDEWCAKDEIEPIGHMQAICAVLSKLGAVVSAFAGHEMKPNHFMPWLPPEKKQRRLTAKESAVVLTAHLQGLAREVTNGIPR